MASMNAYIQKLEIFRLLNGKTLISAVGVIPTVL